MQHFGSISLCRLWCHTYCQAALLVRNITKMYEHVFAVNTGNSNNLTQLNGTCTVLPVHPCPLPIYLTDRPAHNLLLIPIRMHQTLTGAATTNALPLRTLLELTFGLQGESRLGDPPYLYHRILDPYSSKRCTATQDLD